MPCFQRMDDWRLFFQSLYPRALYLLPWYSFPHNLSLQPDLKDQNLTVKISEDKTAILPKHAEDAKIILKELASCHDQPPLPGISSLGTPFPSPSPHIIPPSSKICNSALSSSWSFFFELLGVLQKKRPSCLGLQMPSHVPYENCPPQTLKSRLGVGWSPGEAEHFPIGFLLPLDFGLSRLTSPHPTSKKAFLVSLWSDVLSHFQLSPALNLSKTP